VRGCCGVLVWAVAGFVWLVLLGAGAASARGADGQADPTFGSGGTALYDVGFGDYHPFALAAAEAIQANGDIVIAGHSGDSGGAADLLVVRLTPTGALDPSFGNGGVVDLNLQAPRDDERGSYATAVAVAGNGDIVVGGHVPDGTFDPGYGVVVRLTSAGAPDSSFGQNGETLVRQGDVNGLALTPGGDIVVTGAGPVGPGASTSRPCCLMVAELTAAGSLDGGFGSGGVTTEPDSGRMVAGSVGEQVTVEGDGSIDVLGNGLNDGSGSGAGTGFIARFTDVGVLDETFGSAGFASLDLPGLNDPDAQDLVRTATGFLVTASQADPTNEDNQTVVERFSDSGNPDISFGTRGATVMQGGIDNGVDEQGDALAVRADGSLIVAGSVGPYGRGPSDIWALSADGGPDDVFGAGNEESLPGDLTAAATQTDGRVVLAGGAEQSDDDTDLEAIRLLGPGNSVPSTGDTDTTPPGATAGGATTPPGATPPGAATGGAATTGVSTVAPMPKPTASPPDTRPGLSLPARATCRTVRRRDRRPQSTCTLRIHTSTAGRVTGTVERGRRTVARFTIRVVRGTQTLTITLHQPVTPGRYRLILTQTRGGRRVVTEGKVHIAA
jgi:uncharacterized delta-60 repeat protein